MNFRVLEKFWKFVSERVRTLCVKHSLVMRLMAILVVTLNCTTCLVTSVLLYIDSIGLLLRTKMLLRDKSQGRSQKKILTEAMSMNNL